MFSANKNPVRFFSGFCLFCGGSRKLKQNVAQKSTQNVKKT